MYEMVHIEIEWFDIGKPLPEQQVDSEKDRLWFRVDDCLVLPIEHPAHYTDAHNYVHGSIKFTPMNTDGEFYITPYKNNIDVELDMVGLDEAFGSSNDVQRLGIIALERKNAPYAGVESWYFSAIALYRVGVYTTHTEDGNDSETEYELLGILDTSKLPLALEKALEPAPVSSEPIAWPESPRICECGQNKNSDFYCPSCGGLLF